MPLVVECVPGEAGEPEPARFWFGRRQLTVRGVVDRWYGPTQRWFRLDADDGQLYVLRHDEATGAWELAALTRQ
jgi:hypothetical protein